MEKEAKNRPQKGPYVESGVKRGPEVEIRVNGRTLCAYEGETIGTVLTAHGIRQIRHTQHRQEPRGLYCCMGSCYECLVTVDGQPNIRACVTPVQQGQQITLQKGFGRIEEELVEPIPGQLIRKKVGLVVIGAGPAGLNAAIEAARVGAKVLVIDEGTQPGGQIYRQPPSVFDITDSRAMGDDYADGRSLLDRMHSFSDHITIWNESLVWSVFKPRILAVIRNDAVVLVESKAIVVAAGAYERPVPVPGWTLPGVMTAGGAQVLLKSQRVIPGQRVLLAGSGPLQLVVANQMLDAGIDIAAIAESRPMHAMWRYLPDLLRQPALLFRGSKYLRRLRQKKIPFLKSYALTAIKGEKTAQRAVLSELDHRGRPIPKHQKTFEVDTVCIGYGLIPHIGLTRLLGCGHTYNSLAGGWTPLFDDDMQTDQDGVFVAGDCAGVAGVLTAREQGRLAGLCAATHAGIISGKEAKTSKAQIRRRLSSLQRFRRAMDRIYKYQPSIYASITDDTVVCRCEEVTAGTIRKAIRDGSTDINDIKKRTRVGMGYCQGVNCLPAVAAILSNEFGVHENKIILMTARPPVKPIPVGLLNIEVPSDK
jgi:NADPH-dependent 2,4-dienoyl-CoA reductase/sulfur reductase-like enzyme